MRTLAVLCLLTSCSVLAKADQVSKFQVLAFAADGTTYSGYLSANVTTGQALSFTISNPGDPSYAFQQGAGGFTTNNNVLPNGYAPASEVDAFYGATKGVLSASVDFDFYVPVSSFIGYTGSSLCSIVILCPGLGVYNGGRDYTAVRHGSMSFVPIINGSVTLIGTTTITATPEPSSLALLGTGLLGVVGMIRRRL